ncbi:MAG: response regulator, partial [Candidatus Sedimenticola sp. (ex Thyasira tokunagai)]
MSTENHILIVEDEIGLAELLRDYLEAAGYTTTMLHEGQAVVEWVKRHSPDLILLDLMLPGKDGMGICKEVRAFSELPIIRCQPWRAKRGLVIPGSREAALLTRRARSAPEGKQSRHPNTASSQWE